MKRALCYGDSNTFGLAPLATPSDSRRYDGHTRWPRIMATELEGACEIVEEGLPGRTTVHADPIEGPT